MIHIIYIYMCILYYCMWCYISNRIRLGTWWVKIRITGCPSQANRASRTPCLTVTETTDEPVTTISHPSRSYQILYVFIRILSYTLLCSKQFLSNLLFPLASLGGNIPGLSKYCTATSSLALKKHRVMESWSQPFIVICHLNLHIMNWLQFANIIYFRQEYMFNIISVFVGCLWQS